MPRSHATQRKWKTLSRIMKDAEAEIERRIISKEENLCVSGLYGRRSLDPTAREAINNVNERGG